MGYVTVTGGQEAIGQAADLVRYYRLKDADETLQVDRLGGQLGLLVHKVMSEGSLYAPELAALAIKQAQGDPYEATFLLRAYRSTLARLHYTRTIRTEEMRPVRRISATFRDVPGGQILGPTYDYMHRMLDFSLRDEDPGDIRRFVRQMEASVPAADPPGSFRKVLDQLREDGFIPGQPAQSEEVEEEEPYDITRRKMKFPSPRSARLQALARGETGAMSALAYSNMRGYGTAHPTIGELRAGHVPVYVPHPYADDGEEPEEGIYAGEIVVTEVEMVDSIYRDPASGRPSLRIGFRLVFGHNEQKAIAMSILERCLENGGSSPAENEEFVLSHIDGIDSGGFLSHLKLPHYVTFQSKLERMEQAEEELSDEEDEPI